MKQKIKDKWSAYKDRIKDFEIEDLFSSRWFILILGALILLKTVIFYSNTVFQSEKIWLWSIRQTIFFIIILLSPLLLLRNAKSRFLVGFLINFIVSIILFADELYFEYSANILSVMQTGNLQYKDEIIAAIPSLLRLRQLLYFIDFPIIIILFIRGTISVKNRKNFEFKPVIIMIIGIMVLCTNYKFVPESMELVNGFEYNKTKSVRYGTIYGYHAVDILSAITNSKTVDYPTYDDVIIAYNDFKQMQNTSNLENEAYKGIAKDMNVIVVQLESIQDFVIGQTINGKEITPNLNKFFAENIQVTNMHASSYTTTADSEHSFITSMYPLENGEAFSKYYSNTYDDIFTNLKEAGYTNTYAHGNHSYFWNRKNVFSKYPVDKIYFLDNFKDTSEMIRTYLSDELLYRQVIDELDLTQGKVFVDLVAASSHKPFELSGIIDKERKVTIDVGEYKEKPLGYYLESCNYADYAFGILLEKIKEKGMYDNTVILVYGDHYGMTMYDEDLIKFLGEDPENYNNPRMQAEFTNVACGIRIPGIQNIKIEYPTSKVDLKTTILQILGIEEEITIGKSIFDGKPSVIINNGKIITNEYFYDASNWYYLSTGEKIDLETIPPELKQQLTEFENQMKIELGISNSIVVENLLKEKLNKQPKSESQTLLQPQTQP
ncbi:MAG: LTA synthase family protein [Clostridia bacterium]|nr:LTA synthase family protein [Clostridia bacterium]